jgi:hypothetical protein
MFSSSRLPIAPSIRPKLELHMQFCLHKPSKCHFYPKKCLFEPLTQDTYRSWREGYLGYLPRLDGGYLGCLPGLEGGIPRIPAASGGGIPRIPAASGAGIPRIPAAWDT